MQDWIQIIIAVVSGGAITTAVQRFNLLKSDKRKGDADAERVELENDDIRLASYKATINDLNDRMATALSKMRELEDAISNANAQNMELKAEVNKLKSVMKNLTIELETEKSENDRLRKENAGLKARLEVIDGDAL